MTTKDYELDDAMSELFDFLIERKVENLDPDPKREKSGSWTHILLDKPYGNYNIDNEDYSQFIKLYTAAFLSGNSLSIAERQKKWSHLKFELTFKHESEERQYTDKTIRNVIRLYGNCIRKILDVPDKKIVAFVLEKKAPILKNGTYQDTIQFHYPHICAASSIHYIIRNAFIKKLKNKDIFKKLELSNEYDDIFDQKCINGYWLMYGSKKENSKPYKLTHVYSSATKELPLERYGNNKLPDLFCTRKYTSTDALPLNQNTSNDSLQKECDEIKKNLSKNGLIEIDDIIKTVSADELAEIKVLVSMLSPDRIKNDYEWEQLGLCLHNLDFRLFDEWAEITQKYRDLKTDKNDEAESDNENENETIDDLSSLKDYWKNIKPNNYSMATLYDWASTDDPKKFHKYREDDIRKIMMANLGGKHGNIAKVFNAKYKYKFVCASMKHETWYEYKNHRWHITEGGASIMKLLMNNLQDEYYHLRTYYYTKLGTTRDEEESSNLKKKAESLDKIVANLNDHNFIKNTVKALGVLVHDQEFCNKLDSNLHLIGMENGVFDLKMMKLRKGCPDDFISMTTKIRYRPLNKKDETYKDMMSFLGKIQTDKAMLDYLLKTLALCLSGENDREEFFIHTGKGGNGKSKTFTLLKLALGDYYKPLDIRVLTQKRGNSSSASPEMADKKGVRACTLDEPEMNVQINIGYMKNLSGNDPIGTRALFKDMVYFIPQFKLFLICNVLPDIKSNDEGTWRRIRVVPYESKFTHKPNPNNPREFHRDDNIMGKIDEWKEIFFALLVEKYKEVRDAGGKIDEPAKVREWTDNYQKTNDLFMEYMTDNYEISTDDKSTHMAIKKIWNDMKTWIKESQTADVKCPKKKELEDYLKNKYPENVEGDIIYGIRVKEDTSNSNNVDGDGDIEN